MSFKFGLPCRERVSPDDGGRDLLDEVPPEGGLQVVVEARTAGAVVEQAADVPLVGLHAEGELPNGEPPGPHVVFDPLRDALTARGKAVILVREPHGQSRHVSPRRVAATTERAEWRIETTPWF
jgi:hypothetical protein